MIRSDMAVALLLDRFRHTQREFLHQALVRFPSRDPTGPLDDFVEEHLADLTGLPNLWPTSWVLATWRGMTFVIVTEWPPLLETDLRVDSRFTTRIEHNDMDCLCANIDEAARWVRESPADRRIVAHHLFGNAIFIVMVWVYVDMLIERSVTSDTVGVLPSMLLHDVLSELHGRDRRVAASVCRAWQRGASDSLLPVDDSDVCAWTVPRVAELARVYPSFSPTGATIVLLWTVTRYWLEGGS
jgi:hypothetical protein